jgi:hypothetical protein
MPKLKYFIILFIGLGLLLSSIVSIEYECSGPEMFPTYYGSPFIYKMKSLGSSMEYFYSISGLLVNVLIWCLVVMLVDFCIQLLIKTSSYSTFLSKAYKLIVGVMLLFSLANVSIAFITLGRGFDKPLNYWYWDFDDEAKLWGMKCERKWRLFYY